MDGRTADSPTLDVITAWRPGLTYISTSDALFLRFQSDKSLSYRGFNASFRLSKFLISNVDTVFAFDYDDQVCFQFSNQLCSILLYVLKISNAFQKSLSNVFSVAYNIFA